MGGWEDKAGCEPSLGPPNEVQGTANIYSNRTASQSCVITSGFLRGVGNSLCLREVANVSDEKRCSDDPTAQPDRDSVCRTTHFVETHILEPQPSVCLPYSICSKPLQPLQPSRATRKWVVIPPHCTMRERQSEGPLLFFSCSGRQISSIEAIGTEWVEATLATR